MLDLFCNYFLQLRNKNFCFFGDFISQVKVRIIRQWYNGHKKINSIFSQRHNAILEELEKVKTVMESSRRKMNNTSVNSSLRYRCPIWSTKSVVWVLQSAMNWLRSFSDLDESIFSVLFGFYLPVKLFDLAFLCVIANKVEMINNRNFLQIFDSNHKKNEFLSKQISVKCVKIYNNI